MPRRSLSARSSQLVCALLAFGVLASCGGGKDSSKPQSKAKPSATSTPSDSAEERTPLPPVGVRVVDREASAPAAFEPSAEVTGPATVQVRVSPSRSEEGARPTLTISRTSPRKLTIRSRLKSDGATEEATIDLPGSKLAIGRLAYSCRLPPDTFCPVQATRSEDRIKLRAARSRVPLVATMQIEPKSKIKATRLVQLRGSAPGSPVQATALLAVPSTSGGKTPSPTAKATADADSTVLLYVRPARGSAEGGRLRIVVPRKAGESLKVQAGGTASDPSSTATIRAKSGRIRIADVVYSCLTPPATFCPVDVDKSSKRSVMVLDTPRVGLRMTLRIAAG